AEDGIRDFHVTGVQTCALPIYLQGIITENLRNREEAAEEAKVIIAEHAEAFTAWLRQLDHVEVIRDYRQRIQQMAQEQLQRAHNQLAAGKEAEAVLQELTQRLTNQFLHQPTRLMPEAGAAGDDLTLAVFQRLIADDE